MSNIKKYTSNFKFKIPNFNIATWHDEVEYNFVAIDALFSNFMAAQDYVGEWKNVTEYEIGNIVFISDEDSEHFGELFKVLVDHTTTDDDFDTYLAAHPTYYELTGVSGAKEFAQLARDWATKMDGKVVENNVEIDYSSKYYATNASTSASNASTSESNALSYKNDAESARDLTLGYKNTTEGYKNDAYNYKESALSSRNAASTSENHANVWAEGTDEQVAALGGVHSAKGWQALSHIIQLNVMPTASSAYSGQIYQYVGTTDATYTQGYFYKCTETVVSPAVSESLTVTQTSGTTMGSFTTDYNVFKTAIGTDRTWTYQFSCIGKPRIISVWKMSDGMDTDSFTRDSTFDIAQLHQYGWIDDGNNWYFTNTEFPDETTVFYNGSSDEVGTPTNVNSGWQYMATTGRQTAGMGIWVIGANEDPVNLADYGIYNASSGLIGDVLSVAYTAPALAVNSYTWQNIDVNMNKQIGEIIQMVCSSDYTPDGCLPCDGAEYTKAQFNELWTNYLASSPAKLLTCSYADYQTDITTYGQCAKFAIDTTNNVFKVPTLPNKLVTGQVQNIPVIGDGKTLGLTDGTKKAGLQAYNYSGATYMHATESQYGTNVGTTAINSAIYGKTLGITTDPTKSGIVADLSTNTVTLRSFVVVSNGQINQASMDWSQWATSLSSRMGTNASNVVSGAFENIVSVAQSTGKSTIVGWGCPDYTRQTSVSLPYTATADGIFFFKGGNSQNTVNKFKINNLEFWFNGYGTASGGNIPMKKGQQISWVSGGLGSPTYTFVPYSGE